MSNIIYFILTIMALVGCMSEQRTNKLVQPITYQLPEYRISNSIGNLRRLAIAPVQIDEPLIGHISDDKKIRYARDEAQQVATFLNYRKGYEIVLLYDGEENWQPDSKVKISLINNKELASRWLSSSTEEQEGFTAKEIGQKLGVDGVVSIWVERSENPTFLEDMLAGLLTIALLDLPLFYGLFHESGRVVIYETATGLPIWRASCTVLACPTIQDKAVKLFTNIENALPAQLLH